MVNLSVPLAAPVAAFDRVTCVALVNDATVVPGGISPSESLMLLPTSVAAKKLAPVVIVVDPVVVVPLTALECETLWNMFLSD